MLRGIPSRGTSTYESALVPEAPHQFLSKCEGVKDEFIECLNETSVQIDDQLHKMA